MIGKVFFNTYINCKALLECARICALSFLGHLLTLMNLVAIYTWACALMLRAARHAHARVKSSWQIFHHGQLLTTCYLAPRAVKKLVGRTPAETGAIFQVWNFC